MRVSCRRPVVLGRSGIPYTIKSCTLLAFVLAGSCAREDAVRFRIVQRERVGMMPLRAIEVTLESQAGSTALSSIITSRSYADASVLPLALGDVLVNVGQNTNVRAVVTGTLDRCRAIARSGSFVHRSGPYDVFLSIGCADQFVMTGALVHSAHNAATAARLPDGSVILAGGSRTTTFEGIHGHIQRFSRETGTWAAAGELLAPRIYAAPLETTTGVLLIGGASSTGCTDMVELVTATGTTTVTSLASQRCSPGAALLRAAEAVVIAGSGLPATGGSHFEVRDSSLRTLLATANGSGTRVNPSVFALSDGRSALVLGGGPRSTATALAEIVHVGSDCSGQPVGSSTSTCVEAVSWPNPPPSEAHLPAAYLDCVGIDGKNAGGAVVTVGGFARVDPPTLTDEIWCMRDAPNNPPVFRQIGRLQLARGGGKLVPLRPRRATQRGLAYALLVGGFDRVPRPDALIVRIDPCTCAPVVPTDIETSSLPEPGVYVTGSTALQLEDESILVPGTFQVSTGLDFASGSLLFTPDEP